MNRELELYVPVNEQNHDPRVACVLVMDVSYSMSGAPITALSDGYKVFIDEIQNDPLARKRAEVSVVTFGTSAHVVIPFQEAQRLQPTEFETDGSTDMAGGINLALDQLEERKSQYRAQHLEYFRPWLFLMTDGAPNHEGFEEALRRLNQAEAEKRVEVFAVGVGENVNWDVLKRVSKERGPLKLNGLAFAEMFQWLSASLSSVSESVNFGYDDSSHREPGEQIALPPVGWGTLQ
ncbi:vWA domain-containing protein [Actinomyces qiguomingii]|uniref:vWA domain-containing protein n=2 Tax=Actinomyces qiguomingii TaxID=2057800 RepID=UPI000CA0568A|nr:VWA domain-containing protein [Actinomyces qiguomingii]